MNCPICSSELLPVGFPDDLGYQTYRCPNGCEFWNTWRWRTRVFLSDLAGLFLWLIVGLIVMPLALTLRVAEKTNKVRRGLR